MFDDTTNVLQAQDTRAQRLEALARALDEELPARQFQFDMTIGLEPGPDTDYPSCGSVGCIAGMAYVLWLETIDPAERREPPHMWASILHRAADWLRLESSEAAALFTPGNVSWVKTPAEAAEAVRRLARGEEPWPVEVA